MNKYYVLFAITGMLTLGCTSGNKTTKLLQTLQGDVSTRVCQYNGNKLTGAFPLEAGSSSVNDSTSWLLNIKEEVIDTDPDAMDLEFRFSLEKGKMTASGVAVEFKFANWDTSGYVFAPAAVYNGNRYRMLPISYPPYIYEEKDKPSDMPVTITNVPRLSTENDSSRIEMLTSNCTTPMLGFYDKKKQRGFILITTQDTPLGNSGLTITENPEQRTVSFIVSAPGIRENKYVMTQIIPSDDQAVNWQKGDQLSLRLRVYNFEANSMEAFYAKMFDVRKALSGTNEYLNRMPFSETASIILNHHDKTKWFKNEKYGYICNGPQSNSPYGHIQTGWSGIPAYALPQAIQPTAERISRVSSSLDVLRQVQGKSGLFYGMFKNGTLAGDNFAEMEKKPAIAMIRRTGLTLYMGLQIQELMRLQGNEQEINPEWDKMFRKSANGLVDLWQKYGQFGQFVNVETGEMDINNSTAGAINIAALALAARHFGEPRYLEVAEAAANLYCERDLKNGYTGGGPAEILQCPDSESAAELTESLTVLYEVTGKQEWLNKACFAASVFSSWVVSYDYKFPQDCDLQRINAKVTGSVWASVQNEHSAPGIYILSGDFLLKLYRATGNEKYAELLKDIAHNVIQYVTTPGNPLGKGSAPGSVSERVNLSDWEGKQGIGAVNAGDSNMAWETVALLSIQQNPGIYIQTDTDKLLVLDHVNAKVIKRTETSLTLEIENPTAYPAQVSLFAENNQASKQPLGLYAYTKWPKIAVPAKQKVQVSIDQTGSICNQKN